MVSFLSFIACLPFVVFSLYFSIPIIESGDYNSHNVLILACCGLILLKCISTILSGGIVSLVFNVVQAAILAYICWSIHSLSKKINAQMGNPNGAANGNNQQGLIPMLKSAVGMEPQANNLNAPGNGGQVINPPNPNGIQNVNGQPGNQAALVGDRGQTNTATTNMNQANPVMQNNSQPNNGQPPNNGEQPNNMAANNPINPQPTDQNLKNPQNTQAVKNNPIGQKTPPEPVKSNSTDKKTPPEPVKPNPTDKKTPTEPVKPNPTDSKKKEEKKKDSDKSSPTGKNRNNRG